MSVRNRGVFLVTERCIFLSLFSLVLVASAAEWPVRTKVVLFVLKKAMLNHNVISIFDRVVCHPVPNTKAV